LAFLEEEEVELLPWLPRFPDLSPIEKVWDTMEKFIDDLPHSPTILEELQGAVAEAWEASLQEFTDNAIAIVRSLKFILKVDVGEPIENHHSCKSVDLNS
jgi:hypothetical protein